MSPFDGATYERVRDKDRLSSQIKKVAQVMLDGKWHTLSELSAKLGYPESSISARVRDLRKEAFGGYDVEREFVARGLYRYRVVKDSA